MFDLFCLCVVLCSSGQGRTAVADCLEVKFINQIKSTSCYDISFSFQQKKENQTKEDSSTAKSEVTKEKPTDESSSSRDNVQVLGEDENVREKSMEEMIDKVTVTLFFLPFTLHAGTK